MENNDSVAVLMSIKTNKKWDYKVYYPERLIIGKILMDKNGNYINENGKTYRCFDNDLDIKSCYMFPETLKNIQEIYASESDYNICEIDNSLLNEALTAYFNENCENIYYSKDNICNNSIDCYKVDISCGLVSKIDPSLNFWTADEESYEVENVFAFDTDIDDDLDYISEPQSIQEQMKDNQEEADARNRDFNYKEVSSKIKEVVKGQDKAINQILVALKDHIESNGENKATMLVIGKSGSGKTEIFRNATKHLGIDYIIADATKLTKEGYVGESLTDYLKQLYINCNRNLQRAQKGLFILDEIDKKAQNGNHEKVGTKAVLDSCLSLMEDGKITVPGVGMFDTSNMMFACLGAFSGIDSRDIDQRPLGFGSEFNLEKLAKSTSEKDIENYGIAQEFIGRINYLIELNPLTKDILIDILLNSPKSALLKNAKFLKECRNIILKYDDSYIDEVLNKANYKVTGARSLNKTLMDTLLWAKQEIYEQDIKNKELVLTGNTVKDPKVYTLK